MLDSMVIGHWNRYQKQTGDKSEIRAKISKDNGPYMEAKD